jgi:hypothetical protein
MIHTAITLFQLYQAVYDIKLNTDQTQNTIQPTRYTDSWITNTFIVQFPQRVLDLLTILKGTIWTPQDIHFLLITAALFARSDMLEE